mmetsp:Transcript_4323/g.11313  ORF Transcript_4323/g.11313 Transcript_4323/m.11313 type:complete len:224 (+) Transcript_4323:1615-2286(+)
MLGSIAAMFRYTSNPICPRNTRDSTTIETVDSPLFSSRASSRPMSYSRPKYRCEICLASFSASRFPPTGGTMRTMPGIKVRSCSSFCMASSNSFKHSAISSAETSPVTSNALACFNRCVAALRRWMASSTSRVRKNRKEKMMAINTKLPSAGTLRIGSNVWVVVVVAAVATPGSTEYAWDADTRWVPKEVICDSMLSPFIAKSDRKGDAEDGTRSALLSRLPT